MKPTDFIRDGQAAQISEKMFSNSNGLWTYASISAMMAYTNSKAKEGKNMSVIIEDIATVLDDMGIDGVECREVLTEEKTSDACLAAMQEGMRNRLAFNAQARFASEQRTKEQRVS